MDTMELTRTLNRECVDCGKRLHERRQHEVSIHSLEEGIGLMRSARLVCGGCYDRHWEMFHITTVCPFCAGKATSFYRAEVRAVVIGCLSCDRKLQEVIGEELAQLSDEKREQLAATAFDYWANR